MVLQACNFRNESTLVRPALFRQVLDLEVCGTALPLGADGDSRIFLNMDAFLEDQKQSKDDLSMSI